VFDAQARFDLSKLLTNVVFPLRLHPLPRPWFTPAHGGVIAGEYPACRASCSIMRTRTHTHTPTHIPAGSCMVTRAVIFWEHARSA
jgi:hypothetical protein